MKNHESNYAIGLFSLALIVCWLCPANVRAQLLVGQYNTGTIGEYSFSGALIKSNYIVTGDPYVLAMQVVGGDLYVLGGSTISEYTKSGVLVKASVVSGVAGASDFVISGNDVFISNESTNTIGEYNLLTGAAINSSLIKNLSQPSGLAISGNDIFVTNANMNLSNGQEVGPGFVGEFTLSGQTVNASLISGLDEPLDLGIYNNDLYVSDGLTIHEYAKSGAVLNPSVATGLYNSNGMTSFDGDLYVTESGHAQVDEYTLGGATIAAPLFSGLNDPGAIVALPEPSPLMLFFVGFLALASMALRLRAVHR